MVFYAPAVAVQAQQVVVLALWACAIGVLQVVDGLLHHGFGVEPVVVVKLHETVVVFIFDRESYVAVAGVECCVPCALVMHQKHNLCDVHEPHSIYIHSIYIHVEFFHAARRCAIFVLEHCFELSVVAFEFAPLIA